MSGQQGEPLPRPPGGPPGSARMGTLTSLSDGREFSVGFTSMRIGRQWRADLIISDKSVSRQHADIIFEGGRYVLYDHSTDRTWVNGSLVQVAQPLRDGDAVRFGRAEFRFALRETPAPTSRTLESEGSTEGAGSPEPVIKEGKRWRRSGPAKLIRRALLVTVAVVVTAAVAVYLFLQRAG